MALSMMTIEEIKKKIKNEVPLQTIADLNGLDLKTFEKIIRQYEEEHNEQILPKRKPGRPKTDTPARSTKYARAKAEREKKFLKSLPTIEINPKDLAIIDVIEGQIDSLKDEMAKRQVEINNMTYQVERWEFLKSQLEKEVKHGD